MSKRYYGQDVKSPFKDPQRAQELAGITGACHKDVPMEAGANSYQPGGDHYIKYEMLQPWDIVAIWGLDFFQGNILKYIARWRDKGGINDLIKAKHYLEKYIEVEKAKQKVQREAEPVESTTDGPCQSDRAKQTADVPVDVGEVMRDAQAALDSLYKRKAPLDATGDNRKGLIDVGGIKFDPQRNYEMIGGTGVFVPPETAERSKEIFNRLKEVDEERLGEAAAHPERFGANKRALASLCEEAMTGTEPLDQREDREYYERAAKELGLTKEELRAQNTLLEAERGEGMDVLAAEIAKDGRDAQHVELPHVDGNGSPVDDSDIPF